MTSIDNISRRQAPSDSNSDSTESVSALQEDDGWEDAEQDQEDISIVSLFDDGVFPDVHSMVEHCKSSCNFDLIAVLKDLGMTFMRLKLVHR